MSFDGMCGALGERKRKKKEESELQTDRAFLAAEVNISLFETLENRPGAGRHLWGGEEEDT